MTPWMAAATAAVAVAFGIISLALMWESLSGWLRRRDIQRRLEEGRLEDHPLGDASRGVVRKARQDATAVDRVLLAVPQLRDLSVMMAQGGVGWTPQTFLLLTCGGAIAGAVVGTLAPVSTAAMLIMVIGLALLPYLYVRRRRSQRMSRFEELFPESIDLMGRAIRAGHPLYSGIQMVGEEMADPVGREFRQVFEEQRFGVPFPEALLGMCDRIDLVDVRIFTTAVLIQREVGGNLAEILDNLSSVIRARFSIRRQLRVYTAQGRMSGLVVGSMPFVIGTIMYLQQPSYVRVLFDHPMGRIMFVVAVVLQIFGYLWIRKIVNIEI